MSNILERAKAHYAEIERKTIDVPEWGEPGKPLVVTCTPLTVAERRKIFKVDAKGHAPDGATACVRAVVLKACDKDGKRLFSDLDEHDLTYSVDSGVVGRIAGAILVDVPTEDAEEAVETAKND